MLFTTVHNDKYTFFPRTSLLEHPSFLTCSGSAAAGNKSTTRLPLPHPGCRGEWKERGRKLVGRDKGTLTEQKEKGTITTTIQLRRKHNTNRTTRRATLHDCHHELPSRK